MKKQYLLFFGGILLMAGCIAILFICLSSLASEITPERVGKGFRDLQDNFNKGYNDTTKTK